MSRRRITLALLSSTSVTMAASCSPTINVPPGTSPNSAAASVQAAPVVRKPEPTYPLLIAHRGGTADRPENTLVAIDAALANHADMIWLSVQLSADGIPVLYRPAKLSALTELTPAAAGGDDSVASRTFGQLQQLNVGWHFAETDVTGTRRYPYRTLPVRMPSLQQALRQIPANVPVVLDMKAMPADVQTEAVARVLDAEDAWGRVLIYSTEAAYQTTFGRYPKARVFESRDATRQRLLDVTLAGVCDPPGTGRWAGIELRRPVDVIEHFTLGQGVTKTTASFWTPKSVACYRARDAVNLVAFGVNDKAAYCRAMRLGLDAVMVDSPAQMSAIRAQLKETPQGCPAVK